jgi:hypothetical protein
MLGGYGSLSNLQGRRFYKEATLNGNEESCKEARQEKEEVT